MKFQATLRKKSSIMWEKLWKEGINVPNNIQKWFEMEEKFNLEEKRRLKEKESKDDESDENEEEEEEEKVEEVQSKKKKKRGTKVKYKKLNNEEL